MEENVSIHSSVKFGCLEANYKEKEENKYWITLKTKLFSWGIFDIPNAKAKASKFIDRHPKIIQEAYF